jgi:dihydropteroate synthase
MGFDKPLIMGILNVTPDSFSDGGQFTSVENAIKHAKQMLKDGADIIDVGGESTRPGSDVVSLEEELARVLPVIDELLKLDCTISIDTMKPEVAEECLKRGVHMLNDVTGLRNPKMVKVAAKYNVPVVIMHMRGIPKTMQVNVEYDDVVEDIKQYLQQQANVATEAGISQIILDPGIGFGKSKEDNYEIIRRLREFTSLGYPILVGPSRKSFLGGDVKGRLPGTLEAVKTCVKNGATIVRVHDVKECKEIIN